MSYESPIELLTQQMRTTYENEILKAVQAVGVNVNKDELLKALQYDRDQYLKGRLDGYFERDSEIVRCKDCKHYMTIRCVCDGCCISPEWFCASGEKQTD